MGQKMREDKNYVVTGDSLMNHGERKGLESSEKDPTYQGQQYETCI